MTSIRRCIRPIGLMLLISACCLLAATLQRSGFFQALSSVEALQNYISSFAPYSHLCFFLIQLLSVILAPIPSNVSAAAGGVLFGTWAAFSLTMAAVVLGSMLVFSLARVLGRSFTDRVVSRRVSQKYQELIHAKTDIFLILAFLFPFFPDDMLCILAGLTRIPPMRFLLILLFTRPWGLLFASALGGNALSLPPWSMIPLGAGGFILFFLGMKYGDRVENSIMARLGRAKNKT